jgi:uncharacterized caspase-like protein
MEEGHRSRALFVVCFIILLFCWPVWAQGPGRDRIALVIGNSSYQHWSSLANPSNDAEDVAAKLTELGFNVSVAIDVDRQRMSALINTFAENAQGAETAIIYYAGHGLSVSNVNYLIPVDAISCD